MRINADTTITGERVVLVPYRPEHVPRYHGWMASPELQALTASEPLSLEEEFAMQRAWADDGDKLTFILLDPSRPPAPEQADWPPGGRVGAMAGDGEGHIHEWRGAAGGAFGCCSGPWGFFSWQKKRALILPAHPLTTLPIGQRAPRSQSTPFSTTPTATAPPSNWR